MKKNLIIAFVAVPMLIAVLVGILCQALCAGYFYGTLLMMNDGEIPEEYKAK